MDVPAHNGTKRSWIERVKHPKHLQLFRCCFILNSKTCVGSYAELPVSEIRLILIGDGCGLNSPCCYFAMSEDDKMFSPFAISLVDSTFDPQCPAHVCLPKLS